jgi:raffinose/stachyose/melibiose transport system substrate-binding protein
MAGNVMVKPFRTQRRPGVRAVTFACAAAVAFASAAVARPAVHDTITLQMITSGTQQPGYDVLIPNFERVYPNVKVNVTYAANGPQLVQLELTELAAGNGPDILTTLPGCNSPIGICELAAAGDAAPMVEKPWAKRSLPFITSLTKNGPTLYAFEPTVGAAGMFTNDDLFKKLGLKVPQTFRQLLDVCKQAAVHGIPAIEMNGAPAPQTFSLFLTGLAVPFVYGADKHFTAEQKAGKQTFVGSAGWRQGMQELVTMNQDGCFQPGMPGQSAPAARAAFAGGQALIYPGLTDFKGSIDADDPQFSYTFHSFPAGTSAAQVNALVIDGLSLSVNGHASAANQAAAQEFVDFLARPKQDALFAQLLGSVTQYEFLKGRLPSYLSPLGPALAQGRYVINPQAGWWNGNVLVTLETDGIGLVTGQTTVGGLLSAMDASWNQGPA